MDIYKYNGRTQLGIEIDIGLGAFLGGISFFGTIQTFFGVGIAKLWVEGGGRGGGGVR